MKVLQFTLIFLFFMATGLKTAVWAGDKTPEPADLSIDSYIELLEGKKVGVVTNHTAMIDSTHLVDTLLALDIKVKKIFAPEHGFRGDADAGEVVKDGKDTKTGLPIISLYGSNKKPTADQLNGLNIVVFDIQDVGARFYTYISTMHYVMEACAENKIPFMVLDRPNPNGHYVDGPVLDMKFQSFVGMHPIPIVHGLTVGELAKMINGEGWLKDGIQCELTVIPCKNYAHYTSDDVNSYTAKQVTKTVPNTNPSPNLRSDIAIWMYPSLCLFEPTVISVGRGTMEPFTVIGTPYATGLRKKNALYAFVPKSIEGMSKHPKHEGDTCYGIDFKYYWYVPYYQSKFTLEFLIKEYNFHNLAEDGPFFTNESFFNKLVGNDQLIAQIKSGKTEQEIRATWEEDLKAYKLMRKKYLLYKE